MAKTHRSALVVIPPREFWDPIQAIRRTHDRNLRRWMPHITLIYPFVTSDEHAAAIAVLRRACERLRAFTLRLSGFRMFRHGRDRFTLWLSPEPRERLVGLQRSLQREFPECDDVSRFATGYLPHLSVGQVAGVLVRRHGTRDKQDFGQVVRLKRVLGQDQVPRMHRVKGAAEYADPL